MAEEITVGKTKDFDMTFEQRERYLRETEKEEMRKSQMKYRIIFIGGGILIVLIIAGVCYIIKKKNNKE